MEKNKPVVVGIGELLWDVLPTGKRAGGAPINFVYHATQMGAEGYAVSAVGNDLSGTEIVQELEKNHISNSLGTVEYPTGSVMVELKDGIPTYTIIEGRCLEPYSSNPGIYRPGKEGGCHLLWHIGFAFTGVERNDPDFIVVCT